MENIKKSDELMWFQLNQTTTRRHEQLSRTEPGNFDEGGGGGGELMLTIYGAK